MMFENTARLSVSLPADRYALPRHLPDAGCGGSQLFTPSTWWRLGERLALTRREVDVLKSVFDDRKESSIAEALGISTHTVHTYLERIYRKLNVNSRCQLLLRVFTEYLAM